MAFRKKMTAAENLAERVATAQEAQTVVDNASQSETITEAVQRLRELQDNFKKPEVQKYFSDDTNRTITELIELYDRLGEEIKNMFGIDTAAVKFIAVYNASERGIVEKKQETDAKLAELEASVVAKETEVAKKLQETQDKIAAEESRFGAILEANRARVAVEIENFRKDQRAQAMLELKGEIAQLRKEQQEVEDLKSRVESAEKKAAEAEQKGYDRGVKETLTTKATEIASIKSNAESSKSLLEQKLAMRDDQISDLRQQLEDAKAENKELNAQLVKLATAQFAQPATTSKG